MAKLFQWYLDFTSSKPGDTYLYFLHGVVVGHTKIPDGTPIHTSEIKDVEVLDEEKGIHLVHTLNTQYVLDMEVCSFSQTELFWEKLVQGTALPDWLERLRACWPYFREQYRIPNWDIPLDGILLRLGNHGRYYFDGMAVLEDGEPQILRDPVVHIGCFQDSVLCWLGNQKDGPQYDLRYFPQSGNRLEFYCWYTGGLPVYLENSGQSRLTAVMAKKGGEYTLDPGQRVRPAEMLEDRRTCTLAVLEGLGVDVDAVKAVIRTQQEAQRAEIADELKPWQMRCEFWGNRCIRAFYKSGGGEVCQANIERGVEAAQDMLCISSGAAELRFLEEIFHRLVFVSCSPEIREIQIKNSGTAFLRLRVGETEVYCMPGVCTPVEGPARIS